MNTRPSLDKDYIRNYVGQSSFQKGENYATHYAIRLGKIKQNVITALCQGHAFDPYKVEAIFDREGINQSYCSCPVGAGGKCKHVAALLLTWVDHPELFAEWEEIRDHLKIYDSQTLLELIDLLEEKVAGSADVIHAFQHNLENSKSPYLAKYLKRVEEAFQTSRLPWYHPDEAIATEVAFSLGKIQSDTLQLIEHNHFNEAIRIYQSIIQHILSYLDEHKDPWGTLGEEMRGCTEGLERILMRLSFEHELRQKVLHIIFRIIEEQIYRETNIGGDEARKIILDHIQPAEREKIVSWVKAIQASHRREERAEYFWLKDFLIDLEKDNLDPEVYLTHYRQTGQMGKLIDSLLHLGRIKEATQVAHQVEFKAQVLILADIFLRYNQEKVAEGLVLEAVRQNPNIDLLNWLKDFYLRKGQRDQALAQILEMFHLSPQFSYYQELQDLALHLGKWKEVQKEILDFLKNQNDQTLLIEIYLDEKDLAQAIEQYQIASKEMPGTFKEKNKDFLILRLAALARYKYPQVAIGIYQEIVQDLIEERNRESYRRACEYLRVIREIYKETHHIKGWSAYLRTFMQTYSRFKALKDEMQQANLI